MDYWLQKQVKYTFRPEFLNRIDDIIVFRPLGAEELERIVDLQLGRLERLLAERRIRLRLTPEALARDGFDPAFGARPLKRSIQRLVQNPLAMHLLEGHFEDGDTIVADREEGAIRLTFRRETETVPAA